MEVRFFNLFLKLSAYLFSLKNRMLASKNLVEIIFFAVCLIFAEIFFFILSIPLFLFVPPKKIQEKGFLLPRKEKQIYHNYIVRRKIAITTSFGAGGIFVVKTIFVVFLSFYLLGVQTLLADTQDWPFDVPASYTYDSAKIEVTGGVARLKNLGSIASGSTTNPSFDANSTGWTAVPAWIVAPSKTNTASWQSTGGNPNGYVDINLPGKKSNDSAGYWYQAFTTTVNSPDTATLSLDWKALGITDSPSNYHLYAFIGTNSGNPTVGGPTQVWDSGNLSSTTSWASTSTIDIRSKVPTAGTYYLKIAAYHTCPASTDCSTVSGFDNVAVNWSKTVVSYDTSNPTITPTTSLNPTKVITWNSFTETATKNGGEIYYQLSDDDGASWKYWNGSAWASVVGGTDYNTAPTINTNIGTFPTTNNKIRWKAFLSSNGSQQVILDHIAIGYTQNSLPVVASVTPVQNSTAGYVYVNYNLQDNNSDPLSLTAYEYSLTGAFAGEQATMTPVPADPNHQGVSGLSSSPAGVNHTFVWDAKSQVGSIYDGTVYVRLRANDGIGNSNYTTSGSFAIDYVNPIVSNVTAIQTPGTTNVVFTYDLADDTSTDHFVEVDISEDGGSTWLVNDASVTGAVGSGVSTGVGKTITWSAKTDFADQVQNDIQVRVRAKDKWQNQGANTASANFSIDTLSPATSVASNLKAQPNAGDTVVLIGGSFTETNPNTNDFYVAINDGAYSSSTAGTTDTATPSDQNTAVGATLDGNDYISKVKITHTDDFGQATDNENLSPSASYKYVKPYTPQAPTLSSPVTTQLNITINPHASEASDLEYLIQETTTGNYVQTDGTLGASPVWKTTAQWGTKTVTGLTSPVANYIFKVKSRNPNDIAHAVSSESAYSATSQITNTAPSISYNTVAQTTDGTKYTTVAYTGTDGQGDLNNITTYQYSQDNATWYTMTEKSGVGSEGVSSLVFLPSGSAHNFVWDSGTDLSGVEDSTVYVRLQSTDTIASSAMATSSAFEIDNVAPVVTNVSAVQNVGARTVTITYDLSDANSSLVEIDISNDSGLSWSVVDTAVSGAIGGGVAPGVGKSITWNAGTDFDDQYQTDVRVRVRAKDTFGNQGSNTQSSDFTVDTNDPVISNVSASQNSASDTFTFNYDVSEDAGDVDVTLEVSSNGGSTWTVPITSALGDFGSGIASGTGKSISWNASVDYNGYEEQDMRIRVTAEDSFSNTGLNSSSNFNLDTLAPRVTSVNASQTLGSTNVSITYTLADQNNSLVEIDISDDGGLSWSVVDSSATGDIGSGQTSGSKTITWNAGSDFDEQDQSDIRVRVRAKDTYEHQSANVSSGDFALDTLNPATNVASDLLAQPNAGATTVLIGGSFTESNPNTNNFYVAINGSAYSTATSGSTNTATPVDQNTTVGATLDGNDYISQVKISHTDDFGQTHDNENSSPNSIYKYVKPYTPDAPTVDNPTVGTVDVLINPNTSETSGLEYAIYETSQGKYVQANGTLGVSAVWQVLGTGLGEWGNSTGVSGKVRVNGLANHSYTYEFKTISRNTSDAGHASSSESALSGGASSENQSPVIVLGAIAQTTDGTKYVTINYTGSDLESESTNIIVAEYSTNNINWYTMTEKSGVGSDGKTGLTFAYTGTAHDFMWDVGNDLANTEDSTVYIRLQAYDGTSNSSIVTSSAFVIDTKNPVISLITASQTVGLNNVSFGYTLTDLSNSTVLLDISEDSGSSWSVTDASVSGDINSLIAPGPGKSVTWDAGSDFDAQEQTDMRVRFIAQDSFGNQGSYAQSSDFDLDTKDPVVANVSAVQNAGASTITITYDLSDANNSLVEIDISEDSGSTWGVIDTSATGDIGSDITPGVGNSIIWDAGADFPNRDESDLRVRVRAIDIYSNNSGDISSSDFSVDTYGPVISNVSAVQTLGSENVVITYNLVDSASVNVSIDISEDGGSTWTVTDSSATGAVGAGVIPGTGKVINWYPGTDFNFEEQSDMRVVVRGTDSFNNSSGNIESSNFIVDTLDPSVNIIADIETQPNAGATTVLIGGSFTESNPDTNDFYVAINGNAYGLLTAGSSNTANPANQATAIGATLDGNDYISKVRIIHTDDYDHGVTNENLSPSASYKYVKPYTPQAPIVNNPQNTSVDVTVVPNASETSGLEYAIYESSTGLYVQSGGTLGVSPAWRTTVAWGTISVTGLTSPVANYEFQVKSRNTSDATHALSSESNLSSSGSISNSAPSISISSAAQQGLSSYALIDYIGTDVQNDTNNINSFEYSTNNVDWYTMTEKSGVGSDGVSDLIFSSAGSAYTFGWDIAADLPNTGDSTVYVRLQSSDTLASSNVATSSAFAIDTLGPVISNILTSQTPGTDILTFSYDLSDDSVAGNEIEIEISSDSGSTWVVPTTTLAGDVGLGISADTGKSVTWDAGTEFNNQESSTMRLRIRGTDAYDNVGSYYQSSDFTIDTKNPVVANVSASQVAGSTDIEFTYDLVDATVAGHFVELDISDDSGLTWTVTKASVTGAVGAGQTTGTGKTITWDAGADFADDYQTDMQVRIRSLDYYGHQGTYLASSNFSVDTASPIISNVSVNQTTGLNLVDITYDVSDNNDLSNLGLQISGDSGSSWTVTAVSTTGDIGALASVGVGNSIIWNAGIDFNNQDITNMRVRLVATDEFGNISTGYESSDFALDTRGPVGLAGLDQFASTDTSSTLTWTVATDTNFDHYELWYGTDLDDVEARSGTAAMWSVAEDGTLASALTSSTVITGIDPSDNLYVKIWAVDTFGNESTTAETTTSYSIIVVTGGGDYVPGNIILPKTPVLNSVRLITNNPSVLISGVSDTLTWIDVYDNGEFISRLASQTDNSGYFAERYEFSEGEHKITVRAVDSSGNQSDQSSPISFSIDLTAPAVPIIFNQDNAQITNSTPVIYGTAEAFSSIEILIDEYPVQYTLSDKDGVWLYSIPTSFELGIGVHEIFVRAIDQAENKSEYSVLHLEVVELPTEAIPEEEIITPVLSEPEEVVGIIPIIPGVSIDEILTEEEIEEILFPTTPPIVATEIVKEVAEAVELPGLQVPRVTYGIASVSGDRFGFRGTALPNSDVIVYVHSDQALLYQTRSDQNGIWNISHSQEIAELAVGEHTIYAVSIDPEAKVKSAPGPVSIFTVEKSFWATLYGYLNLQTTLVALIILTICLVWLYRLRLKGVQNI